MLTQTEITNQHTKVTREVTTIFHSRNNHKSTPHRTTHAQVVFY
jgi:hypothetical protein